MWEEKTSLGRLICKPMFAFWGGNRHRPQKDIKLNQQKVEMDGCPSVKFDLIIFNLVMKTTSLAGPDSCFVL
jgi:hypothetical protein